MELAAVRRSLVELEAAGEAALEGTRPLRLMAAAARRRLVLRTTRGDRVATREISELMRLEREIAGLETFERLRDLTRGKL